MSKPSSLPAPARKGATVFDHRDEYIPSEETREGKAARRPKTPHPVKIASRQWGIRLQEADPSPESPACSIVCWPGGGGNQAQAPGGRVPPPAPSPRTPIPPSAAPPAFVRPRLLCTHTTTATAARPMSDTTGSCNPAKAPAVLGGDRATAAAAAEAAKWAQPVGQPSASTSTSATPCHPTPDPALRRSRTLASSSPSASMRASASFRRLLSSASVHAAPAPPLPPPPAAPSDSEVDGSFTTPNATTTTTTSNSTITAANAADTNATPRDTRRSHNRHYMRSYSPQHRVITNDMESAGCVDVRCTPVKGLRPTGAVECTTATSTSSGCAEGQWVAEDDGYEAGAEEVEEEEEEQGSFLDPAGGVRELSMFVLQELQQRLQLQRSDSGDAAPSLLCSGASQAVGGPEHRGAAGLWTQQHPHPRAHQHQHPQQLHPQHPCVLDTALEQHLLQRQRSRERSSARAVLHTHAHKPGRWSSPGLAATAAQAAGAAGQLPQQLWGTAGDLTAAQQHRGQLQQQQQQQYYSGSHHAGVGHGHEYGQGQGRRPRVSAPSGGGPGGPGGLAPIRERREALGGAPFEAAASTCAAQPLGMPCPSAVREERARAEPGVLQQHGGGPQQQLGWGDQDAPAASAQQSGERLSGGALRLTEPRAAPGGEQRAAVGSGWKRLAALAAILRRTPPAPGAAAPPAAAVACAWPSHPTCALLRLQDPEGSRGSSSALFPPLAAAGRGAAGMASRGRSTFPAAAAAIDLRSLSGSAPPCSGSGSGAGSVCGSGGALGTSFPYGSSTRAHGKERGGRGFKAAARRLLAKLGVSKGGTGRTGAGGSTLEQQAGYRCGEGNGPEGGGKVVTAVDLARSSCSSPSSAEACSGGAGAGPLWCGGGGLADGRVVRV